MQQYVSWGRIKEFSVSFKVPIQYIEFGKEYLVFIAHGNIYMECTLRKDGGVDVTEFEASYKADANAPIVSKTSLAIPKVAMYEPEGFFKSYVSHNLCDPTTWYQESTQVTGETLIQVIPPSGLVFSMANTNIIDAEHGKITGEKNYSLDFDTFTYSTPIRTTYAVKVYIGGVLQTSGYSVNYVTGEIAFDTLPGATVTCDYYYAGSSNFKVEATGAGKVLQIRHVEIQFTEDIGFNSAIIQSIKAYNPMAPPSKIEVEHIEFLNEYDVINIGNEGKGQIIKYGTIPHNINVFPFAYGRTIDLKYSEGSEINVSLENDIPMTGTFSTVTFYTTEEDQ